MMRYWCADYLFHYFLLLMLSLLRRCWCWYWYFRLFHYFSLIISLDYYAAFHFALIIIFDIIDFRYFDISIIIIDADSFHFHFLIFSLLFHFRWYAIDAFFMLFHFSIDYDAIFLRLFSYFDDYYDATPFSLSFMLMIRYYHFRHAFIIIDKMLIIFHFSLFISYFIITFDYFIIIFHIDADAITLFIIFDDYYFRHIFTLFSFHWYYFHFRFIITPCYAFFSIIFFWYYDILRYAFDIRWDYATISIIFISFDIFADASSLRCWCFSPLFSMLILPFRYFSLLLLFHYFSMIRCHFLIFLMRVKIFDAYFSRLFLRYFRDYYFHFSLIIIFDDFDAVMALYADAAFLSLITLHAFRWCCQYYFDYYLSLLMMIISLSIFSIFDIIYFFIIIFARYWFHFLLWCWLFRYIFSRI